MSRIAWSRLLLWIVLAAALSSRAEAQPKSAASQAWVLSFHYGAANLSMDGDSLSRDFGMLSDLRLGHVVDPGVIAGVQARSWSAKEPDSLKGSTSGTTELSRQVQVFTLTGTKFLKATEFYGRGGAGICRVKQEFLVHDPLGGASVAASQADAGFAVSVAAGWVRKLREHVGAGLEVEYVRYTANHVSGNLFTYTAGLDFYW